MAEQNTYEPMLDMFIFETSQLMEQLEQLIIGAEKDNHFEPASINEIFRIMHTTKGSAAMMMFNNISTLSHSMEDVFFYLREEKPDNVDYSALSDMVLEGVDFIKVELEKIKNGDQADGDAGELINSVHSYLTKLKGSNSMDSSSDTIQCAIEEKPKYYISQNKIKASIYKNTFKAILFFEDDCEMENIRAYTVLHNLKDITEDFSYIPENIIDDDSSVEIIQKEGFLIFIKSDYTYEKMYEFLDQTIFLKSLELTLLENDEEMLELKKEGPISVKEEDKIKIPVLEKTSSTDKETHNGNAQQSIISVSVSKLDKLMDLVGEMVIAEAMVIQNPDLQGIELNNFYKASRQLSKITSELQDTVMSIRMVPLSATFYKMQRIVRDMCKKLGKEVRLEIIGEETEVDKNIIEHIADPIMHLVRNAVDHGLEKSEERINNNKTSEGTVTLEAKNAGNDVLILVKDDGKGLDKNKILLKAKERGLLYKNEEHMTDKEIFNLILQPGFSTNESVTEYSGRGVGMDVVAQNIESINGSVSIDSSYGNGSIFTLKIPLTLAIIDGMNIKVGNANYTLPITSVRESFRAKKEEIITDPDGNELIMIRGKCIPLIRLYKKFDVKTNIINVDEGILIIVEQEEKAICLLADKLLGQQQVVVKAMPKYIQNFNKVNGLAGCTLLGDGSISLILDAEGLMDF